MPPSSNEHPAAGSRTRENPALAETLPGEPLTDPRADTLLPPLAQAVGETLPSSSVTAPLDAAALAGTLPPESTPGVAAAPQVNVTFGKAAAHSEFPVANWDHYEFLKLLGRGGMGAVYKARDKRLHRTVALKFIRGADPNLVMRFMQEARAQARIDHPQVCKVYEIGEVQGHAYIAMQYVDGKSLDSTSLQLSLTQKVVLMRQVAEAMHEAHKLGIIHRDLKPANIMLEREVDGSLNPVVMDFGLARESSENHGLTETGAVMGTPAYMAPEQARGETRLIDRRSDVYSLGATLYDLIVGIPPFDAESVMDILLKVISDDAKPLRSAVPSVPPDLETIVMKCLNKEPNQRYDSAKLLAEDLGRYIDGEPILGRRVSLAYRLRRLAQRHRTLVAVSAVFFVVLSGIVGSSIRQYFVGQRERARVAAQAQLERELTQQIKDLEWFLRTAYQLPLHDLGEEQALVRQRMAALPTPSVALGDLGVGLVHYARGRGHQALHETEPALKELRLAQQKGVDTQELHYALGRVLGDRYDQSMQEARRQGEKTWLEGRQKELEKEYLQPALAELERSRGLQLASPDYLDGLIAFYRKQYDQALDQARKAQSRTRWWYEARQLEGDVLLARGTEQKEQGKYDEASKNLAAAIEAYKIASDIGRSDASIYESTAEAFIKQAEIAINFGKPPDQEFAAALAAANHAVVALPSNGNGYLAEARVLFFSARAMALKGKDPSESYSQSIHFAEQALARDPKNFIAWDTLGNALISRGARESFFGKNPEPTWQHAVEAITHAIAIAPNFPWAHNDLGLCRWYSGNYQRTHGHDPRERYQQAIAAAKRAIELDAKYLYAYANLIGILAELADYSQEHGLDFPSVVEEAKSLTQRCGAGCASYVIFQQNIAALHLTAAQHALRKGTDPKSAITLSRSHLAALRELKKNSYAECLFSRIADIFEVETLLVQDTDPTQLVDLALKATHDCRALNAQDTDSYVTEARLWLLRAKWLERHGGNPTLAAQAAMTAAAKAADMNPESEEAAQQKAYAAFLLARQLPKVTRGARLAEGILAIEHGIKVKADSGPLLALHAVLLRASATAGQDITTNTDLQRRAEESWKQALGINPLLEREYGPYLRDPWR